MAGNKYSCLMILVFFSALLPLSAADVDSDFRPVIELEHDYSSMITSNQGSSFFTFKVVNNASEQVQFNTSVLGANARFMEYTGDDWKETYTLEADSSRRFQVEVYEGSVGETQLEIVTRNMDYGLESREEITVFVRKIPDSQVREIPGMEMMQILILVLFSTVLYSASL